MNLMFAVQDMITAMEIARTVGQSHLELATQRAETLLSQLKNTATTAEGGD
jgi:hypothetical protein